MVYHILGELEPFDELRGGALSKTVAHLMKFDSSKVVAFGASHSPWGYSKDRIIEVRHSKLYRSLKLDKLLPLKAKSMFYRHILARLIDRICPNDVVWCHHHPFIAAALEQPVHDRGAKLIYQCHDARMRYPTRVALRSFTPDLRVFGSQALRAKYLERFPQWRNTAVLYYGTDVERFSPRQDGQTPGNPVPVILYAGRLQAEKGVHILLEAISILNRKKIAVVCKIVGSHHAGGSKDTPYIRSLYRKKSDNVQFLGYRLPAELAEEFRSADIFCCPSLWFEAFGMVNVEAMASGLPVVASRVGGIPEIAADGGVVLVEPGSVDRLVDALERLLCDKSARDAMGRDARRSAVTRFSWQSAAQCYLGLVESTDNVTA